MSDNNTHPNQKYQDKVVLVTGGTKGIGFGIAAGFLSAGAEVIVCGRKEPSAVPQVSVNGALKQAHFIQADVKDIDSTAALFTAIEKKYGRLDVLVNNAGICVLKDIESMTFDEFRHVNDVNAMGVFLGTRCAILGMRSCAKEGQAASGSIVNIASIAGQVGMHGGIAYGAGKAAVTNMTKALAVECAEKREFIRVNSVHPGTVKTDMTTTMMGEEYFASSENFSATPMKDFAMPEDIANAVVYLASDQSKLVTGSELTVDGGLTSGLAGEF